MYLQKEKQKEMLALLELLELACNLGFNYDVYDMDNILLEYTASDIAFMVQNNNFDPSDHYFKFDENDDLISFTELELYAILKEMKTELIDWIERMKPARKRQRENEKSASEIIADIFDGVY